LERIGIRTYANVSLKFNAYHQHKDAHRERNGIVINVNANVLLLLENAHKERNGIVINVNTNVLNLQENAYCPNNGIHKHVLVSV
jgi:hypothetical protein